MEWLSNITGGHATEAIIICALCLVVRVLLSLLMASYGHKKGYNDVLCFFLCLVFGIFGMCVTAALPDKCIYDEIDELHRRIDELESAPGSCSGIVADTGDNSKPSGTTAYMPDTKQGSDTSSAVEMIKKYWSKKKKD